MNEDYQVGREDMLKEVIKTIKERIWVWNEEKLGKRGRKEFDKIKDFSKELEDELRKLENREAKK